MKKSLIFLPLAVLALVGCGEKEGSGSGAAPTAPSAGPIIITSGTPTPTPSDKPTPKTFNGYTELLEAPTAGSGFLMGYYHAGNTEAERFCFLDGQPKGSYYVGSNAHTVDSAGKFTVEATTGGFYIKNSSGKYLYMYSNYNSSTSKYVVNAGYTTDASKAVWEFVEKETSSADIDNYCWTMCQKIDADPTDSYGAQYYCLAQRTDSDTSRYSASPTYGRYWGSNEIVRLYKAA